MRAKYDQAAPYMAKFVNGKTEKEKVAAFEGMVNQIGQNRAASVICAHLSDAAQAASGAAPGEVQRPVARLQV